MPAKILLWGGPRDSIFLETGIEGRYRVAFAPLVPHVATISVCADATLPETVFMRGTTRQARYFGGMLAFSAQLSYNYESYNYGEHTHNWYDLSFATAKRMLTLGPLPHHALFTWGELGEDLRRYNPKFSNPNVLRGCGTGAEPREQLNDFRRFLARMNRPDPGLELYVGNDILPLRIFVFGVLGART
jgi:hypothetical protein